MGGELRGESPAFVERGCSVEILRGTIQMPRDPRKVWQYFAHAIVQEEDPEKIGYLTERLLKALADNEEQTRRNVPRSKDAVAE